MEEVEIRRAAELMRKLHGANASTHAAIRAEVMLEQGNTAGFHAWTRIVDRIADLDR